MRLNAPKSDCIVVSPTFILAITSTQGIRVPPKDKDYDIVGNEENDAKT